jgi:hypothetical protein
VLTIVQFEKVCSACSQRLPLTAYSPCRAYKDGYRGQCKGCRSAYTKAYIQKTGYKCKTRSRHVRKRPSEGYRAEKLKQKYGITVQQFDDMLAAQGGCAVCLSPTPRGGRHNRFVVDHCHKTGRVRGVLCHPCNIALGVLGDTPESIFRALAYVTKGQEIKRVA